MHKKNDTSLNGSYLDEYLAGAQRLLRRISSDLWAFSEATRTGGCQNRPLADRPIALRKRRI